MNLKHGSMLTSPQTHNATAKCIESLSNEKRKRKMECGLVNIYAIYKPEGTNGKDIMPSSR